MSHSNGNPSHSCHAKDGKHELSNSLISVVPLLTATPHHELADLISTVHQLPCVLHSAVNIELGLSKHRDGDLSTQAFVLGQAATLMWVISMNAGVFR